MNKKIVFGLAMLITLTASLPAQAVSVHVFTYVNKLSEQNFKAMPGSVPIKEEFRAVNKLPDPVIQAINKNLRDYSLDTGDCFSSSVTYQGRTYIIVLRITNARNSTWQWFAWTKD